MKLTAWIVVAVVVAAVAYSSGPDLVRYMKIKSM